MDRVGVTWRPTPASESLLGCDDPECLLALLLPVKEEVLVVHGECLVLKCTIQQFDESSQVVFVCVRVQHQLTETFPHGLGEQRRQVLVGEVLGQQLVQVGAGV